MTYEQGVVFEGERREDVLRWLLILLGRAVEVAPLAEEAWPPPIQFRVQSIYDGVDRLGDYVLLYEAAIHFHFVVLASQFLWMTHDLSEDRYPQSARVAQRVILATVTANQCMGGRVWLHRAGGMSRAGYDLIQEGVHAPLPELFDVLEPEQA